MAYIDREALIKKIFPYDVVDKKCYTINAKATYEAIKNAPTEDVVPRSEVERWERKYKIDIEICESTIHRLQNILLQFTDIVHKWGNKNGIDTTEISLVPILEQEADGIIAEAKQEVAREIFEDFTKHKVCTNEEDYRVLAELKKKYIGE